MNGLRFVKIILTGATNSGSIISSHGYGTKTHHAIRWYLASKPTSLSVKTTACLRRSFHISANLGTEKDVKPGSEAIQLLGLNGEPRGVMKLRKAEQLAKDEQLKLLPVEEKVTEKVAEGTLVYRLVTAKEFNLEQKRLKTLKQAEKAKAPKSLTLSSTIAKNDLSIKIKQVMEWLQKGHSVNVQVKTGKSAEGESRILEQFTTSCKEIATISNSRKVKAELVFQLSPKPTTASPDQSQKSSDQNQKPFKLKELENMQNSNKAAEEKI